jgi:hypothetical protein
MGYGSDNQGYEDYADERHGSCFILLKQELSRRGGPVPPRRVNSNGIVLQ